MNRTARILITISAFLLSYALYAQEGQPWIHDPSTIMKCDGKYYTFGTGGGGLISEDGWVWYGGGVRPGGGAAPDAIKLGDRYLVAYSATGGGLGGGHAGRVLTMWNKTLDPTSPDFKYTEPIEVASSEVDEDCDAIDAGLFLDPVTGRLWVTYGTYFGFIRVVELDPRTGARVEGNEPVDIAIDCEATTIIYRDGWYYLLGTHGTCCDGVNSTYNIVVGRSRNVTGPYVDNMGRDMIAGGGKMVIDGEDRRFGAGHFGLYVEDEGVEKMSLHFEADLDKSGRSVLAIRPLMWRDGWPVGGELVNEGTYEISSVRRGYALELAVDFTRMQMERRPFFRVPQNEPVRSLPMQTLEDVEATWPAGEVEARIGDWMARPHQKWTITAVPDAGGYLGGPYFRIGIEGTDRSLAAVEGAEVTVVEKFTGTDEQLWRIEQLIDGTYRIMPKAIPGCDKPYVLVSIADSTPTLAEYDFEDDNCKWNLRLIAPLASCNMDRPFENPLLWADVPDPDLIRVGEDFYMVSTTMHLMPGAPVMHSKDLVNWEIVSYIFDSLDQTTRYDMKDGTVYGRGQWATSLRYRDGKFYAYFSPNDTPPRGYVYATEDPRGKWELVSRPPHFHDASLFFDDDGKAYMIYGTGMLRELKPDLTDVQEGGLDMQIFERDKEENALLEGSRFFKHEGKYYLLMISWPRGGIRREVCYRADNIAGPYEKKVVLETPFGGFGGGVAQGTIVDDGKGNWYGVLFQDRGGVGRVPMLMPCTWVDGWPMLGDAQGKVPQTMEAPIKGYHPEPLTRSDRFSKGELGLCWQWNHNPINEAWSLTERPGYMRLRTGRIAESIFDAPNTLTQRMEGPECSAVVGLDLSGMKDGDVAGFSAFNSDAAVLAVSKKDGKLILTMSSESVGLRNSDKAITDVRRTVQDEVALDKPVIWLRIDGDFCPGQDIARCWYSLDNRSWTRIGNDFRMMFDWQRFFMGTKYAIFNYATEELGGYVDVDFFHYDRIDD